MVAVLQLIIDVLASRVRSWVCGVALQVAVSALLLSLILTLVVVPVLGGGYPVVSVAASMASFWAVSASIGQSRSSVVIVAGGLATHIFVGAAAPLIGANDLAYI